MSIDFSLWLLAFGSWLLGFKTGRTPQSFFHERRFPFPVAQAQCSPHGQDQPAFRRRQPLPGWRPESTVRTRLIHLQYRNVREDQKLDKSKDAMRKAHKLQS